MAAHTFIVAGSHYDCSMLIAAAMAESGFTVTPTPTGGLHAARGSTTLTVFLGGLAGDSIKMSFVLDFATNPEGQQVARLAYSKGGTAVKGGAIGMHNTKKAFEHLSNNIHARLAAASVLVGSFPS